MKVPVVQGVAAVRPVVSLSAMSLSVMSRRVPARVTGPARSTRSLLSTGRDSRFVAGSLALLCKRDAGQLTSQDWAVRQDRQVQQWRTGQPV